MQSIRKLKTKFKLFLHNSDFLLALLIILVACASFGLGKLSMASNTQNTPLYVQNSDLPGITASAYAQAQEEGIYSIKNVSVVASRSSDKYHFPWCSGAQRIKEENKILFMSIQEAREAGYEPAANCKGLE